MQNLWETVSPHAKLRLHAIDAIQRCYDQLDNWDVDSPATLATSGRQFLILAGELQKGSGDPKVWLLQPKHHLFIYLCEDARVNPKLEWNYGDEDFIFQNADRFCMSFL